MEVQWEVVGLSATILAGGTAWLYQKAVERQERRIARYERIMDLANSFLRAGRDADGVNATLTEFRKLWLSAPMHVVRAATEFREATDTEGSSEAAAHAFRRLVKQMRQDCWIGAALFPRLRRGRLEDRDIQLMVATRP